jgi:hypothetical protein
MNDAPTAPQTDAPRRVRAQRRADGLVAQYVHELSDRHAATRRRAGSEQRSARGGAGRSEFVDSRQRRAVEVDVRGL